MKKTIKTIMMSVLLLTLLVGCNSTSVSKSSNSSTNLKEAYKLYESALKKTNKKTSVDSYMSVDNSITYKNTGGSSDTSKINSNSSFRILANNRTDTSASEFYMYGSVTMYGSSSDVKAWFKDGVLYQDAYGEKVKSSSDTSSYADSTKQKAVAKEFFESASITKSGSNTILKLYFKQNKIKSYLQSNSTSDLSDMKKKTASIEYTITVDKNGYFKKIYSYIKYTLKVDSQNVTYSTKTTVKYNNFDTQNIAWPDFTQFTESTSTSTSSSSSTTD